MELTNSAKTLAVELCGDIDKAIEILKLGNERKIKADYWQGIFDAINAQNRIELRSFNT